MTVPQGVLDRLVARVRAAAPRLPAAGPDGTAADRPAGGTRLVVVDGPAGSGKSTLAAQLAEALPAQVVHMDDLYDGWSGLAAGVERLHEQVLAPLARGEDGRYERYDWGTGRYAEWHDVPRAEYLVVEGCGAGDPRVDDLCALLVWVETDDALRLTRGLARDGEDARGHWKAWMAAENALYAAHRTARRADVRLDGWGRVTWPAHGI
ncbi:uridine kinase [Isoptericola sp. NPDC057653]|uniref:uridine kinase family protein n=1 Tax=Isoptericola sp. NPDC057653 TaxID=3346195 RepID=UPI00369BDADF